MKRLSRNIAITLGIALAVTAVWMESQGESRPESSIKFIGGQMCAQDITYLERINLNLKDSWGIVAAGQHKIRIISMDQSICEYNFDEGTLWCNGEPIISSITTFSFEYRDGYGNLISRVNRELNDINSVAYIIRISDNKKTIHGYSKVSIRNTSTDNDKNPRELLSLNSI